MDTRALLASLKAETARVRALASECRQANVFLEDLPEELQCSRSLLRAGRLEAALEHLQVMRLDLLARLVLRETPEIPRGRTVAPPRGRSPSARALAAINARIDRVLKTAARGTPPRTR